MPKDRPQCGLLIENAEGKVLLQLRDKKSWIPYPDSWGTFGGQIEVGETPKQAIIREIREELDYDCSEAELYGEYPFENYNIYMFRIVDKRIKLSDVKVREGQRGEFLSLDDIKKAKCAFNAKEIVMDYYEEYHKSN